MQTRRVVKRSIIGSRVYAPGPPGDTAPLTGVVQAVTQENRDATNGTNGTNGPRRNLYTLLMQDGSLADYTEDEIAMGTSQMAAKGPLKSSLKHSNGQGLGQHHVEVLEVDLDKDPPAPGAVAGTTPITMTTTTPITMTTTTRSVSLLEQKRKEVSSSIDVPHARRSEEEVDMDKVTAAMVLTSLSTSPLVRSPPVRANDGSCSSSGGYWSWSVPSDDQSNPSTPSPPLSADALRPRPRTPSLGSAPDDALDDHDSSSLLFDEPIPRKRKNSMKVMFKCLWKNCGKVLSTAAGIQRHIRTNHLGRNCESECSDGEEDFYYTEIKLNTDAVAEGVGGPCPLAPPSGLTPPGGGLALELPHRRGDTSGVKGEPGASAAVVGGNSNNTPLSRSAPSALYLVHTDHAYQATAPMSIPSSSSSSSSSFSFTPTTSSHISISWQSPPVTFTGRSVSPTHTRSQGFGEQQQQQQQQQQQRSHTITALSSPPRATSALRKARGEGRKCRKVYGMEHRDMWCTACRWKKACQRFTD